MKSKCSEKFCGQIVNHDQLNEIVEIIETFPKLSRNELANTVCELFSWKRPSGKLKSVECRQFLEHLEGKGLIKLPACRKQFANKSKKKIIRTDEAAVEQTLCAKLKDLLPISLKRVAQPKERKLWYEYVDRYHYLGYQLPFGAQLRFFIKSDATDTILGCFQFSSPAWRMAPRDQWIGWSDEQRQINLQKIINNSRFLIFPWVSVRNLASAALSLAVKTVPDDWYQAYGYRPVLMETLVEQKRFKGTCYKAANWVPIGQTTGRGRMDRAHKRKGASVKDIYVYPLTSRFRRELVALS